MATGTIRLQRVFRTNPERVCRAFLDRDAMAKWLAPHGFTCKVHLGWQESLAQLSKLVEPGIPD
jgi:hypothetical protein